MVITEVALVQYQNMSHIHERVPEIHIWVFQWYQLSIWNKSFDHNDDNDAAVLLIQTMFDMMNSWDFDANYSTKPTNNTNVTQAKPKQPAHQRA
jgi:hypothetical protein